VEQQLNQMSINRKALARVKMQDDDCRRVLTGKVDVVHGLQRHAARHQCVRQRDLLARRCGADAIARGVEQELNLQVQGPA
jgi:hypothetical protein